jgi:hypothetical protein
MQLSHKICYIEGTPLMSSKQILFSHLTFKIYTLFSWYNVKKSQNPKLVGFSVCILLYLVNIVMPLVIFLPCSQSKDILHPFPNHSRHWFFKLCLIIDINILNKILWTIFLAHPHGVAFQSWQYQTKGHRSVFITISMQTLLNPN